MNSEDAYRIRIISEPHINGNVVYYTLKWIENSEYRSSIYRITNGNAERITFGGHERSAQIHNQELYYIRSDEKAEYIMKTGLMTEPRELLKLKKIEKFVFHGEDMLIIGTDDSPKDDPFFARRLNYRFDSRGLIRARKCLYVFDGSLRKLLSGDFDVTDIVANSRDVILSITNKDNDAGLADIYRYSMKDNSVDRLTEGSGIVSAMGLSESGEIAYSGHREGIKPWAVKKLFLLSSKREYVIAKNTGNGSVISDLFQGSNERIFFYGDSIFCTGQDGGNTYLFEISHGNPRRLTDTGTVQDFFVSGNHICTVRSFLDRPSVLEWKGETYDPNGGMAYRSGDEILSDGCQGWCMIADKNAPNLVFVHGGPHMAYGHAFMIEFQYFFSNGYNVMFCNPRGSSGYGEEFAAGCVGDWGPGPARDIQSFIETAREKYGLTGKFGITGGSYGGYMTNWMITHTEMFAAAISERCVSNLLSMCGTSDIGFWFNSAYMGIDDPWREDSIRKLMDHSPISKVKNAKTPTMFIHGEEDYRCPIEQAEQMFVALKMNGVDTELVRYQGDSHEHARSGKPKNMVHRLTTKMEWFDRYMKES